MTRINSFYAFHGTTEQNALSIGQSQVFNLGTVRKNHWLGQGVYFYREDEHQAYLWARNKIQNISTLREQRPAVVEVIIEVNDLNILNLDSRDGLRYLNKFTKFLHQQGAGIENDFTGQDIQEQEVAAVIRCFVLSMLPSEVWVIQRTFYVPSKTYDNSEMLVKMDLRLNGVQVCVRNCNAIKVGSIKIISSVTARAVDNIILKEWEES